MEGVPAMGQNKLGLCSHVALGPGAEVPASWLCDFHILLSLGGPRFVSIYRPWSCFVYEVAVRWRTQVPPARTAGAE